ncbi:hypothetical protein NP590_15225 [Methylomonas sp. SURF-2]|uniref:Uncharacterized protein n=1 Tax=Methylomonas subterranea TaxID=2952225 RepID=A0ABT1TJ25_9GAMM|nr:hypothetical protein [Methylomonas sp. SURF-2]MCQ8105464.1 hypothetical protein [Methylomonas sp. SURF-2]
MDDITEEGFSVQGIDLNGLLLFDGYLIVRGKITIFYPSDGKLGPFIHWSIKLDISRYEVSMSGGYRTIAT